MSQPMYQNVTVPSGEAATPATITAAISVALSDLQDRAVAAGRRVVWDTVSFGTDEDTVESLELGGQREDVTFRTITIEALTLDPKEVSS